MKTGRYRFGSDFQESVGFGSPRWIKGAGHHQQIGLEHLRMLLKTEQPFTEFFAERKAFFVELAAVKDGSSGQSPADGHLKAAVQEGGEAFARLDAIRTGREILARSAVPFFRQRPSPGWPQIGR